MPCDEECVRSIVKEELAKVSTMQPTNQSDAPKKTKRKSTWNIFLADCTKRQPEGTALGDRAKRCSVEYKELKKNGSLNDVISKLSTPNNKNDENTSQNQT